MWVCPLNHRVRAPGYFGRSFCRECTDYVVPVKGSPVLIGSTEPVEPAPVPVVVATVSGSVTFQGIADAMASQWGGSCD